MISGAYPAAPRCVSRVHCVCVRAWCVYVFDSFAVLCVYYSSDKRAMLVRGDQSEGLSAARLTDRQTDR